VGQPRIDPKDTVLVDVSNEVGLALVQLDQVREEVEDAGLTDVLDGLDKAQGSLRRL
jgi:hypothetical protein